MNRIYALIVLCLLPCSLLQAQGLSGTYTIDQTSPTAGTNFNNFTDAFTALNTNGVDASGVTFDVLTGQTFTETPPTLTATGSSGGPVLFRRSGSGNNPVIKPGTAGTTTISTTASALGNFGDAVIRIAGGDYIEFNGIDLDTNSNYTTSAQRYEYGYHIVKGSATDGSQYVTIRNCNIRLNAGLIHSSGIYVAAHGSTGLAVTPTATSGRHQNILIRNNTIRQAYTGIQLRGYNHSTTPQDLYDHFNRADSNVVLGFGGGSTEAHGIYAIYQDSVEVAYNELKSATNAANIYGIRMETSVGSSVWVRHNTVTLRASSGTIYSIFNDAGDNGTNNFVQIANNEIKDCYNGGTVFYGIRQEASAALSHVSGNHIHHDTLTAGGSAAYIIWSIPGTGSVSHVFDNHIHDIINTGASGSGTMYPVICNNTNETRVYRNNIHDITTLSTGGTVILRSNASNFYCYNNMISRLYAPNSTNANAIIGIELNSGTTNQNVYYNTVYLDASSTSATNFGTSCLDITTTIPADVRNNILVNNSTPGPTGGIVAAYRRSSSNLSTYSDSSNNNCFYVDTPAARKLIFYDGINSDQSLQDYQTRVGPVRDNASFSELPPFVNITTAPYNLHLQTSTPTACSNGGKPVLNASISITTDYNQDMRDPVTPDVGADEFGGIAGLCSGTPTAAQLASQADTVCPDEAFSIIASGHSTGLGLYQFWEMRPAGGAWSPVPGATSDTLQYQLSQTTEFRFVDSCAGSQLLSYSDTFTMHVQPLPVVTGISETHNGLTYQFGGLGVQHATSYLWAFGDNQVSTDQNPQHTYTTPGNYTVQLVVSNDCGLDTASITIQIGMSVGSLPAVQDALQVYPNPATDQLQISAGGRLKLQALELVNSLGAVVLRQQLDGTASGHQLQLPALPAGYYMLRIHTSGGLGIKPVVLMP